MGKDYVRKKILSGEEREDLGFILNELRRASVLWNGRAEALRLCRRPVVVRLSLKGDPIYKFEWQCAKCSMWDKDVDNFEVDHIDEVAGDTGPMREWEELLERIKRLYARPVSQHLQVLCKVCHAKKTNAFMNATKRYSRKTE